MRYGDADQLSHILDGPLNRGVVIRQYVPPAPKRVGTKQCRSCKQIKSLTDFYGRSCNRPGWMSNCMKCHSAIVGMRSQRARDSVKINSTKEMT